MEGNAANPTYLTGKAVPVDVMLRALVVVRTVVEVDLLELVPVGERAAGNIYMLLGVLLHPEDQRLASVVQRARYLYVGGCTK